MSHTGLHIGGRLAGKLKGKHTITEQTAYGVLAIIACSPDFVTQKTCIL